MASSSQTQSSRPSTSTATEIPGNESLNMNVGILGHVDSGKTSLVKALSTLLSTAALDKSKQSRQRGMTLDLGFSCFHMDTLPEHLQKHFPQAKRLQMTLVDCPGHASLIRTIIGGAQIIDVVVLVIDAVKGWQAQTTECLVLAELCCTHLIVALNKVDLLKSTADDTTKDALEQAQQGVRSHLKGTKFENSPIVGVAACVGGEKVAAATVVDSKSKQSASASTPPKTNTTTHLDTLITTLWKHLPVPHRDTESPFCFAVDHCFAVRGRGTVVTGTCLRGTARIGDTVAFPDGQQQSRKIKSIQVFRQSVPLVQAGDRAGMCVSHLDANTLERGLIGPMESWTGGLAVVRKVRWYTAGRLPQQAKFHVSVGHATVMATVTFWGARELLSSAQSTTERHPKLVFDPQQDFLQQPDGLLESWEGHEDLLHWAWVEFATPVRCPHHSLIIGSRLDAPSGTAECRLAFSGRLLQRLPQEPDVRWYTPKERRGVVARLGDAHVRTDDGLTVRYEVFGSEMFKKETDMKVFIGMKVATEAGDIGEIKSSFGTAGKCRIYFPAGTQVKEGEALIIRFKRYANDPRKAMHQDDKLPAARPGARVEVETKKRVKEVGVHRFGEVSNLKGDVLANGKHSMAIVSGFFAPEVNIKEKVGRTVVIPGTGEEGKVVGPFGKAGKCKVAFENGISASVGDKAELRYE